MKIGVKIGPATERRVKHVAEDAETAGFDSVWLSERLNSRDVVSALIES